jgi:hypothetical protein
MISPDKKNIKREFNPFNLRENNTDNKNQIRFERMGTRIKTRPLWWLILGLLFALYLYWYLNTKF